MRDGAHPAEATGMVDLSDYPDGTRLLVRCEPLDPGAQQTSTTKTGKDTGLANLPSADFAINSIWLQLVLAAQDLFAFFTALALDGDLAKAEPKTIRYRLLHVAGRITTSARRPTLHLDRDWPWLDDLIIAFQRIRALPFFPEPPAGP